MSEINLSFLGNRKIVLCGTVYSTVPVTGCLFGYTYAQEAGDPRNAENYGSQY